MIHSEFAPRFRLALHALRLSRVAVAATLQVDKSLVGRWCSGAVNPNDHNLNRVTRLVAEQFPHFTTLDWQRNLADFTALLGLDAAAAMNLMARPGDVALPNLRFLEMAKEESRKRGSAYEGFWRTTRPSMLMRDKVFHDYGMIRSNQTGMLEVVMAGSGLDFSGWAFTLEGNLFAILDQAQGFTPLFLIFRGTPLPRAMQLEGVGLLAAMDAGRTPMAFPLILERIGDLSGDAATDEATCRELGSRPAQASADDIDAGLRSVLFTSPDTATLGDPMLLLASALLSRGSTRSGDLQG